MWGKEHRGMARQGQVGGRGDSGGVIVVPCVPQCPRLH